MPIHIPKYGFHYVDGITELRPLPFDAALDFDTQETISGI